LVGSGTFALTLPPVPSVPAGTGFTFTVLDTCTVRIIANGTDLIDNGPITLRTNDRYHIISDGGNAWHEVFRTNAVSPRFSGPIVLATYTVASLPASAAAGAKAFVSNGRKPSEGAGSGSGVEVFYDGQRWVSSCSGAAVAA
jgi:hypothetical protein